jgi:hypothetical protein
VCSPRRTSRTWQTYGFIVIQQAVPSANVEALKKLLWRIPAYGSQRHFHLERRPAPQLRHERDQQEWYGRDLQHQTLWNNRQEQRLYGAFADIWDDEKLWVTIDRANLNTPNKSGRAFVAFI